MQRPDPRAVLKTPTAAEPHCALCNVDLRHEFWTISITSTDGACVVCPGCARGLLDRLDVAHAEAGALLESWWETR